MKVGEIGEFRLIEKIRDVVEIQGYDEFVTLPNGDDCFAFIPRERQILLTTDALVEGIHFVREIFPPYMLGVKAAVSNLSDIASCGGIPRYVLVSLILPQDLEVDWILDFYRGLNDTLAKYGTYICGGNISKGRKVSITITLTGEIDKPLSRRGAKNGDLVFVTGTLGDSRLGLEIILSKKKLRALSEEESYLVMRHLSPTPRVEFGQSIRYIATSCIDVSDGFLQDLGHILESSNVGAKIEVDKIPLSSEYFSFLVSKRNLSSKEFKFFEYGLIGGEDYELIFTVPLDREKEVLKLSESLGVSVAKVGRITEDKGIFTVFDGKVMKAEDVFGSLGWEHF